MTTVEQLKHDFPLSYEEEGGDIRTLSERYGTLWEQWDYLTWTRFQGEVVWSGFPELPHSQKPYPYPCNWRNEKSL